MKYQVRIAAGYKPSGIFSFPSTAEAMLFIERWYAANGYIEGVVKGPIPL